MFAVDKRASSLGGILQKLGASEGQGILSRGSNSSSRAWLEVARKPEGKLNESGIYEGRSRKACSPQQSASDGTRISRMNIYRTSNIK